MKYRKHPKFGKEMRTYWDSFFEAYQMGHQPHRDYLMNLLKDRGVKSMLDVGCGTGPLYELIDWDVKYKGVDYSWAMIKMANDMFPDGEFEVQDARSLKESACSWEAVVLLHCIDHVDNYCKAIAEAARVADKYVLIVIWRSFIGEGTKLNPRNMYGKQEGDDPWEDTFLHEYSRKVLEDEFEHHGLKVEHIAEGEHICEPGTWNFIWLLKKT